jgi:hypothetical protein
LSLAARPGTRHRRQRHRDRRVEDEPDDGADTALLAYPVDTWCPVTAISGSAYCGQHTRCSTTRGKGNLNPIELGRVVRNRLVYRGTSWQPRRGDGS